MLEYLPRRAVATAATTATISVFAAMPVLGLEPPADEKRRLKSCERRVCSIILKKDPVGEDLRCNIGRTWQKSKIINGVRQKNISWTFGDAQCAVKVKMPRSQIIAALTRPQYDFVLDKHTIKCQVERTEEITQIDIDMAPKMSFRRGKVQTTWLNVSRIDAPVFIKGALWTVSALEETMGLFQAEMVSEINEFIHEKCAKRYGR
ncbi:MAG: hypothetical protein ACR2PG_02835 [Hyphomicrobiaceae bacterium]